jgi:hypothetical protein
MHVQRDYHAVEDQKSRFDLTCHAMFSKAFAFGHRYLLSDKGSANASSWLPPKNILLANDWAFL